MAHYFIKKILTVLFAMPPKIGALTTFTQRVKNENMYIFESEYHAKKTQRLSLHLHLTVEIIVS